MLSDTLSSVVLILHCGRQHYPPSHYSIDGLPNSGPSPRSRFGRDFLAGQTPAEYEPNDGTRVVVHQVSAAAEVHGFEEELACWNNGAFIEVMGIYELCSLDALERMQLARFRGFDTCQRGRCAATFC